MRPPAVIIIPKRAHLPAILITPLLRVLSSLLVVMLLTLPSTPTYASDTITELRATIPIGLTDCDTVVYMVTALYPDTAAIPREYWALPGHQLVVFSCWGDTRVAARHYYDAPWLGLSDQLAGKHPLGALFISGDRFFGLIGTKEWSADNIVVSELLRHGRPARQVLHIADGQIQNVYWFDAETGVPLGWQKLRNGSPWCEYQVTVVEPTPAFPHELLAGPPTWYNNDGR